MHYLGCRVAFSDHPVWLYGFTTTIHYSSLVVRSLTAVYVLISTLLVLRIDVEGELT